MRPADEDAYWNSFYAGAHPDLAEPSSFARLVVPQLPRDGLLFELGGGNGRDEEKPDHTHNGVPPILGESIYRRASDRNRDGRRHRKRWKSNAHRTASARQQRRC